MDNKESFCSLMETYEEQLDELLGDPLLSDLPQDVTLEELKSALALEYGQAMTVNVKRDDGNVMKVIVDQEATLGCLKRGVRRFTELQMSRNNKNVNLSWKYVWKTYILAFDGTKLLENDKKLKDCGVTNHCELYFLKR